MTDQDREQFESGDSLGKVLQICKEIAFRNRRMAIISTVEEPEHYCRVSSTLYRRREKIKVEG